VIPSSAAIQITGNSHLSRAQLLTVFGEDVDRNILTVPLAERRAELERLPWVEHATVMRLLPDRFRVAIVERKPVAFIRQGGTIGLVDGNGVLLDMASDGDSDDTQPQVHYSFPVVTGIAASDPISVRASRMKLFTRFTSDLGDNAKNLSEVDLSSPEDIKALIPDGASDILVHFGDDHFLHRYQLYQKNLPGWRRDFPKMASADMRYERQVVLEMQPGNAAPMPDAGPKADPAEDAAKLGVKFKAPAKGQGKPAAKPAASHPHPKPQGPPQ
jgi:cell division protein FtsQ